MPRAVVFDIDGVLIDSFEANLKFFQDLLSKEGYALPTRESFKKFFHLAMQDTIPAMTGVKDKDEIQRIVEKGKSRAVPYHRELIGYPDGLEEVLHELSKKYLLGVATSRVRDNVYEAPKLAALKPYFKAVAAYEDTEEHKPHPAPLLFIAEKLGVEPEACVYVGDARTDVIAARAAGMKIIIYSKGEIEGADARTSVFWDLPGLIALHL
jgi:pyrophosphatase PpaX